MSKLTVGSSNIVTAQYTRPADTTAYTAGDVIADSTSAATILTFSGIHPDSHGAIIQTALLIDSAAPATKLDSELYLFDTAPAMQNDNAAWAPSSAELRQCIGVIAFPTASFKVAQTGTNGLIAVSNLALPVRSIAAAAAGSVTPIYGILVARNAYTPTSGEVFKIVLGLLQD